jgi:hypothetical protein
MDLREVGLYVTRIEGRPDELRVVHSGRESQLGETDALRERNSAWLAAAG